MKINKKKPKHWLYLILFTLNIILSILLNLFRTKKNNQSIILYGHKLNGNLLPIYKKAIENNLNIHFLTMDYEYHKNLKKNNIHSLNGLNLIDMIKASASAIIISDHGLHSLMLFLKFTNMKFIDVWHGIPFKGFDEDDFKLQHKYDEIWVTSIFVKNLYTKKFGFDKNIVKVLGYTRTDILIDRKLDIKKFKSEIGIPDSLSDRKIILFAPTWAQDSKKRNIYPFKINEKIFLEKINELCYQTNSICLLRKHLNTVSKENNYPEYIMDCSYTKHPNTEEILLISDVLVCDWSSIAFDYLLLDRPTIFLDEPAPFKKGFTLDQSYRFGHIVNQFDELELAIEQYLSNPEKYLNSYGDNISEIKSKLYNNLADGHVSTRSIERIKTLINS